MSELDKHIIEMLNQKCCECQSDKIGYNVSAHTIHAHCLNCNTIQPPRFFVDDFSMTNAKRIAKKIITEREGE